MWAMGSPSDVDAEVLAVVTRGGVGTVGEVIARLRELDAVLPPEDGLKWFNWLYLLVTEAVAVDLETRPWQDLPWLHRLDVEFAQLYLDAIALWLSDRPRCPRAWVPLFQRRRRPHIARVQFAIAGMNAHINRDLAVAVVRTGEALAQPPRRGGPQHHDFLQINGILERVEVQAIQDLATGIIGDVADLSRLDDIIAMWKVRKARDAAWTNAEVLWSLRPLPDLQTHYLSTVDRMTGFAARGLLLPLE
jgi:hypothetical protein